MHRLIRALFFLRPQFKETSLKNLSLLYPNDLVEQERVYKGSLRELSRLIVDIARVAKLDRAWLEQHVTAPRQRIAEVQERAAREKRGVLVATGHLGSFEVLAVFLPLFFVPVTIVMRSFNWPSIDRWWVKLRTKNGNKVIFREGGLLTLIRTLKQGRHVGLLFDQNVTRKNAIFADWFGRPAATTGAVAAAALSTGCLIEIMSVSYQGDGKYTIHSEGCDVDDIRNNPALAHEEKLALITQKVSDQFQNHIRAFPQGWFWMHRRWRTTADPAEKSFYN